MHTAVAEHVRDEPRRLEYFLKRRIADAQASGIGAECRHHRANTVAGEASALHRTSAPGHARLRMQMAGDFAGRAGRLMAKYDPPYRDFAGDHPADIAG